jgi:hypothetical protein
MSLLADDRQQCICQVGDIAVSLFLKNRHDAGRIIALDEAHKVRRLSQYLGYQHSRGQMSLLADDRQQCICQVGGFR